jgi:hypothetical protein
MQAEQGFQQVRSAHNSHDLALRNDRQPFDSMSMHEFYDFFNRGIRVHRNRPSRHDVSNTPVVQLLGCNLPAWLGKESVQPPSPRSIMLAQKVMLGNEPNQFAIAIHYRKAADAVLD